MRTIKELKYNNIKTLIIEGKTRLNFNYILIKASIDLESRKAAPQNCTLKITENNRLKSKKPLCSFEASIHTRLFIIYDVPC